MLANTAVIPKVTNGDFVSYIALCVNEWCRVHPRTKTNHCVDGLLEAARGLQAQKINRTMGVPPWEPDPELDEMVQEVLKTAEAPKPEPTSRSPGRPHPKIRDVIWNDKGPIVRSEIIIDLVQKLLEYGSLSDWEENFLLSEEEGKEGKLTSAMKYGQTFFTFNSGGVFERLCYRAKLQCPFHIDPGQTKPPPGWDA